MKGFTLLSVFIGLWALQACQPANRDKATGLPLPSPEHQVRVERDSVGKIREAAVYLNDQLDGLRVLFFPSGDTLIVESYAQGNFQGPYRIYYPNGRLKMRGQYRDNKMEGIWAKYNEAGQLLEEVTFHDNLENGPFREYFPSGQLQVEGTYLDGDKEHGELTFYNESGELVKTMQCDRGLCRTVWKADNS